MIDPVQCSSAEAPRLLNTEVRQIPVWPSAGLYLQNRLHIGADESGGIGDQVPQHAGTLLLDSPNATVFQFRQNLQGRKVTHYGRGKRRELCKGKCVRS